MRYFIALHSFILGEGQIKVGANGICKAWAMKCAVRWQVRLPVESKSMEQAV